MIKWKIINVLHICFYLGKINTKHFSGSAILFLIPSGDLFLNIRKSLLTYWCSFDRILATLITTMVRANAPPIKLYISKPSKKISKPF